MPTRSAEPAITETATVGSNGECDDILVALERIEVLLDELARRLDSLDRTLSLQAGGTQQCTRQRIGPVPPASARTFLGQMRLREALLAEQRTVAP